MSEGLGRGVVGFIIGVIGITAGVEAAPLVTVKMVTLEDEPVAKISTADVGKVIQFKLVANINFGAVNEKATIASLVPSVDGLNSARFNIFQSTAAETQIDFDARVILAGQLSSGTGASGGTVLPRGNGNDNLVGVRAVLPTGSIPLGTAAPAAGISGATTTAPGQAIELATGSFRIASVGLGSSLVRMTYLSSDDPAFASETVGTFLPQAPGALRVNGGLNVLAQSTDADPVYNYLPLTLETVPEPATIGLLTASAIALLIHRRR